MVRPGQDEYQKAGFGAVLITVSVLCVVLGLGSIVVSTPCLRGAVMKLIRGKQKQDKVHAEKEVELTVKAENKSPDNI